MIDIESDSELNTIGLAKKKVKNSEKIPVVKDYQKIPLIPEIKLSIEDMKGDPVKLLMKL